METGERLAAYLSGDLDADEHAALQAELARDPALQDRLARIEAADAALAGLDDVPLPAGFEDRLRTAVDTELERTLGDELAAKRARRAQRSRRWIPAMGAAAAAAVVIGVGAGVLTGGGGDDMATDDGGESAAIESFDEDAAGGDTEEGAEALSAPPQTPPTSPRVVATGRVIGSEELEVLARDPVFLAATDQVSGAAMAADVAAANRAALEAEPAADAAGTAQDGAAPAVVVEGDVTAEDREAVAACLPVLEADEPVVPLYAEVAVDGEGRDVIVYAALSAGTADVYDRVEVWMVARDGCQILEFVQQTR